MGLLTCECANIKVYTASNDETLTEFTLPANLQHLLEKDSFFQHVSIHRFGLGGIKIVSLLLVSKRSRSCNGVKIVPPLSPPLNRLIH